MKSAGKNHPCKRIFIRRDEICIAEGSSFSERVLGIALGWDFKSHNF